MNWLRLYTELVNEPKVIRLSDKLFRFWIHCLCMARASESGALPLESDIAVMLRLPVANVRRFTTALVDAKLLDRNGDGLAPHNWTKYQYRSDSAAERMRQFRARHGDVTVTVQSRTEQKQSRDRAETEAKPSPPQTASDDLWREFAELYPAHRFDADFANQMWQSRSMDAARIVSGLRAALKCAEWADKDGKFIPFASKFIGEQKYKLAYKPGPPKIDWENI